MFKTFIKLFAVYFVNKKLSDTKNSFAGVKASLADYAESRASVMKSDCSTDFHMLLSLLVGYLFSFAVFLLALIFSLMWVFAASWGSPDRTLILSGIIFLLVLLAGSAFALVKHKWKTYKFMSKTNAFLGKDWHLAKNSLETSSTQA